MRRIWLLSASKIKKTPLNLLVNNQVNSNSNSTHHCDRLLFKSVLCLWKYLFVTNRSLTIVNHFLMLFFVWKSYLLFVVKFQMFFALTRQLLANFFRKHLKKCWIVVLTEDAYYMACNIQLIIWSALLLIFFALLYSMSN